LVQDALFNTASFAVRMVGTLVSISWVAKALGPDLQGRFGYVHWIAAILGQVVIWGLGITMTRFVAREVGAGRPEQARAAVRTAWIWFRATLIGLFAVGVPAAWIFGEELRGGLLIAVPYAAVIAGCAFAIGICHGLRRFDVVLGADILYYLLLLAGIGLGLGAGDPVVGVLCAFAGARGLNLLMLWRRTSRLVDGLGPKGAAATGPLQWELRHYAIQMAMLTLLGALLWERTELLFLKPTASYEQIGWFTAAVGLSILVTRVPGVLGQVMLPMIAGMHGADASLESIGLAYRRGARLLSLLIVGPVCIGIAAGPAVVQVLLADAYQPAGAMFRILLLPMLLAGVGVMGAKTLIGAGGHRSLVWLTSWTASVKLWLCLLLVPSFGAMGAAVAVALGQGLGLALEGGLAARRYPAGPDAEPSRWFEQLAVGVGAAAGTLGAGWLIGGAVRGTDPLLGLSMQLLGGVGGMLIAALLVRPLAPGDARLAKELLPERLHGSIDRLAAEG
jgi:O-antigen/teichoic acid export membrane protein